MKRSILVAAALVAAPFVGIAAYSTNASAEVIVVHETYVASYEPIYYNGFAHYLYHGHWYYRDHGGWHGYDHEPAVLGGHRGEWAHHWHHWR